MRKSVFLICFLFSLASEADTACEGVFNSNGQRVSLSGEKSTPPLQIKDLGFQDMMKVLQSSYKLDSTWERRMLKLLPRLNSSQLLELAEHLMYFKNRNHEFASDTNINDVVIFNQRFLQSLLRRATKKLSQFNKGQLVDILYFFRAIGITPDSKFVRMWKKASDNVGRKFSSYDRYYASSLFTDLGVSPSENPYPLRPAAPSPALP